MTSAADRTLLALAVGQGGVLSFGQAMAAGLSQAAVARRLRSGEWLRVQPRSYRIANLAPDRATGLWAVVLSAPEAVVAGSSAVWWHRLTDNPPPVPEVAVPRGCGRVLVGVRSTRTDLDRRDRVVRRGLPLVCAELAVVQAIAGAPARGPELLDRALQSGLRPAALSAAAVRWRRHRGVGAVTRLLEAAADGAASEAERVALALLRSAGIRGWVANHPVGRAVVDIAFVQRRIAVEIDGWAWHHTHDRFQRDRQRQNTLVLAGWTVLRFTWEDLTGDPGRVLAVLGAALGG